jgi:lactoylglutathione lyase
MRIAHTMIRVADLERSLDFYTRVLGMKLHRRLDFPEGRFTLAFVGFDDEPGAALLELTHNWDTREYELGTGYGHLAIQVADVRAAVEEIRARGGAITREPKAMNAGTTVIAFVADPDGYAVELVPGE